MVHAVVGAFGAAIDYLPSNETEETVVKEKLLQGARWVFEGVETEKWKHKEAFMAVVDVVLPHGMLSGYVERLRTLVLEKDPETFRRALCGNPSGRVRLVIAHWKTGAEVIRARPKL